MQCRCEAGTTYNKPSSTRLERLCHPEPPNPEGKPTPRGRPGCTTCLGRLPVPGLHWVRLRKEISCPVVPDGRLARGGQCRLGVCLTPSAARSSGSHWV